jgi:hypothetical protein
MASREIVEGSCENCGPARILILGESICYSWNGVAPMEPIPSWNGRCCRCGAYIQAASHEGNRNIQWFDMHLDEEKAGWLYGPEIDRTLP